MKLTDLNPRWTGFPYGSIRFGVTFDCPHCKTQRIGVMFSNPIDPERWIERGVTMPQAQCKWTRSGENFDTLTLTPSIDSSQIDFGGHWHGFITNGEVQ